MRSARGTAFRQWANERITEDLVKGFAMDDERLKSPSGAGSPDYFDELLERIRDIRASERRVYLRVRDILAWPPTTSRPLNKPRMSVDCADCNSLVQLDLAEKSRDDGPAA